MNLTEDQKTVYYAIKNAEKLGEKLKKDTVQLVWRIQSLRRLGAEKRQQLPTIFKNEQINSLNRLLITQITQLETIAIGVSALEIQIATPASIAENS